MTICLGTQLPRMVPQALVIGSAVVPTAIANAFFIPKHLLPSEEARQEIGTVGLEEVPEKP